MRVPKPSRSDVVDCLATYLADCPQDKQEGRIRSLVRDAKRRLAYEARKRQERSTKEWLIRQYQFFAYVDLEKASWFIRWLDRLTERGHQSFLAQCGRCGGSGKTTSILGDYERTCLGCGGKGTTVGPSYCHRCGMLAIADPVGCGAH